jgi:hypothetical protein
VLSTNLILRNVAGDIQSENIIVEVTQNDVDCTGVGVDDLQSLFPIKVFPNPVSDFLTISCTSDNMQNTQIELYSITGVKVYSSISDLSNNSCIDVSRFDKGIYLLKIQSNLGRVNSTIIIQ